MWKPALSVAEYLPRRSTIHAFCCGTTRATREIMIIRKTTTTIATRRLAMSSSVDCSRRSYVDRQPDDLFDDTALTFCKRRLSNIARGPTASPHLRFSFG